MIKRSNHVAWQVIVMKQKTHSYYINIFIGHMLCISLLCNLPAGLQTILNVCA